jgi:hypothetical protein
MTISLFGSVMKVEYLSIKDLSGLLGVFRKMLRFSEAKLLILLS